MNRIQAKLIKNNPSLLKKEIKKLYHEGKLESFLGLYYNPKIINVLEQEKIYLKIDNQNYYDLYSLLSHQEFVDYLLKNHIENINYIPDKMLKDEYLKQYATYLKNSQIDISTLKNKMLLNDDIAMTLLSKINSSNDLEYFLNNITNDQIYLDAINIGEEKQLFNGFFSKSFYKNQTIFTRMLKIYGNKLILNMSLYNIDLNSFIPIIVDEILNGNLNLESNSSLLKNPEIIKAILNSPNALKMTNLLNNLEIDLNILDDNELTNLTEIIYNSSNNKPLYFNNFYFNSPLILKKTLELNHLNIIKKFSKEAFTEDNIILFCNMLTSNKNLINFIDYSNLEIINHPYFITTLKNLLQRKVDPKLLNLYLDLVIKNEDVLNIKEGLNYLKEQNWNLFNNQDKSSFLLKTLISLKDYNLINQMSKESFTKENLNLMYQQFSFKDFINLDYVNKNLLEVFSNLNIESKEDYLKIFNDLHQIKNDSLIIYFIRKYNSSNLNILELNEMKDYLLQKITNKLNQNFNDLNSINILLEDILNGKKSPINLDYLNNYKAFYCATYIADIDSIDTLENIESLPLTVMEKTNKKHLRKIITLLENFKMTQGEKLFLAYNIYLAIGYERAKDLLNPNSNKNYGPVNKDHLIEMFMNIKAVNVMFKKEGNGYVPVLNDEWIKLIFGESYKIKNTPIRNYLNNNQDKEEEINRLKMKIDNDLTLTIKEKQTKKIELNKQMKKYNEELQTFIKSCSSSFNDWDIILEEFFKSSNKSKLKTKLNIAKVNEILKLISNKRGLPDLEVQDELLLNSDVFNYVGYDNQYTINPENAPKRAVHISRKMNNYQKKFPNITLQKDNLILEVYNPQDRRILSAGYRTKCCFKPNGTADNYGKDNSLLYYCATNEYGGAIEIKNLEGETIMFSPILRNGNVLMIHSIETKEMGNDSHKVHELLKEYANKTILESSKNDDDISFVTVTDLHNLDTSYTIGSLPNDKRFNIYQADKNMYHNLDREHYILARKEEKFYKDIKYDVEVKSYDYPKQKVYINISITKEEQQMIMKLQKDYQESIKLINERYLALKNNDEDKSYELLFKINEKKKIYLSEYQEILKWRHGRDLYQEYMKTLNTINKINEELKINIDSKLINIKMGNDWYIAYDENNNQYAYALESGQEQLKEELSKINNLKVNEEVMKL